MTPSPFQSAIYAWPTSHTGNLVIDAKAGSGKTTTLIELLKCLPVRNPGELTPARVSFFAFNKHIADTLRARCPSHVNCRTFHSLGLAALRGVLPPGFKIESAKCRKLVWNAMDRDDPDINNVVRLVGLAKTLPPVGDVSDAHLNVPWNRLIEQHELEFEDRGNAVAVASAVLRDSNKNLREIDFDDMLYLPILLNAPFDWQDWVLVDEAQDTNDIQVEMLWRLMRPVKVECDEMEHNFTVDWEYDPTGNSISCEHCGCQPEEGQSPTRFVFVGDPHQAIYGFRGANSDAMQKIVQRFAASTLPLSVCYRCSRAVIREAQLTVKDIFWHENAPEGEVTTLPRYLPSDFPIGSSVLCRNTAPLVGHAYALLQRDVPCTILGKDIGANLIGLVRKMRAANIPDLGVKLAKWRDRELDRAVTESRSPEPILDQYECICFFVHSLDEDSQSVPDLIAKIELLFADNVDPRSRVILSTIHKSKGLEYPTVFLLDRGLLPSRYATQPWQRRQEMNLLYVARTRAIERLVYIESDQWKTETNTKTP